MVKAIQRKPVSSSSSSVLDGKIVKSHHPADHEQVEIQMYLSKLRQLVPNMPKNRKVSKVEVINNVIDYICDLQTALLDQLHQQHPVAASISVSSLNNNNNNNSSLINGNSNSCASPIVMETSSSADCPTC
jgi:DNA-binding protein inhibitor ID